MDSGPNQCETCESPKLHIFEDFGCQADEISTICIATTPSVTQDCGTKATPGEQLGRISKSALTSDHNMKLDIYNRILGPTADETILEGINTLVNIVGKWKMSDSFETELPERDDPIPLPHNSTENCDEFQNKDVYLKTAKSIQTTETMLIKIEKEMQSEHVLWKSGSVSTMVQTDPPKVKVMNSISTDIDWDINRIDGVVETSTKNLRNAESQTNNSNPNIFESPLPSSINQGNFEEQEENALQIKDLENTDLKEFDKNILVLRKQNGHFVKGDSRTRIPLGHRRRKRSKFTLSTKKISNFDLINTGYSCGDFKRILNQEAVTNVKSRNVNDITDTFGEITARDPEAIRCQTKICEESNSVIKKSSSKTYIRKSRLPFTLRPSIERCLFKNTSKHLMQSKKLSHSDQKINIEMNKIRDVKNTTLAPRKRQIIVGQLKVDIPKFNFELLQTGAEKLMKKFGGDHEEQLITVQDNHIRLCKSCYKSKVSIAVPTPSSGYTKSPIPKEIPTVQLPKRCTCRIPPIEIRYAVVKISKFEEFNVYEVYKTTKKRPKKLPSVIEEAFTIKVYNCDRFCTCDCTCD